MKKIGIIGVLILTIIIGGFSLNNKKPMEYTYRDANFDREILTHEPLDLFEQSTEIVVVEICSNKKNNLVIDDYDKSILFGYTTTTVDVISTYKGDVDKSIVILEEYWLEENFLYSDDYYEPLEPGEKYILFLRKSPDEGRYKGTYYIVDMSKGKYPIITNNSKDSDMKINSNFKVDKMNHNDFFLNPKSDLKTYKEWYKSILKELEGNKAKVM